MARVSSFCLCGIIGQEKSRLLKVSQLRTLGVLLKLIPIVTEALQKSLIV